MFMYADMFSSSGRTNKKFDILALLCENQWSLLFLLNGWLTIADFDTFQLPAIKHWTSTHNYDNCRYGLTLFCTRIKYLDWSEKDDNLNGRHVLGDVFRSLTLLTHTVPQFWKASAQSKQIQKFRVTGNILPHGNANNCVSQGHMYTVQCKGRSTSVVN